MLSGDEAIRIANQPSPPAARRIFFLVIGRCHPHLLSLVTEIDASCHDSFPRIFPRRTLAVFPSEVCVTFFRRMAREMGRGRRTRTCALLRLVMMMAAIRVSGGLFPPSTPEVPRYRALPRPRPTRQAGKLPSAGAEMAYQAPNVCDSVLALRIRGGSGADGRDIGRGWFEFRDASTGNAYVSVITSTQQLRFHG
jgi:hypothetical protein